MDGLTDKEAKLYELLNELLITQRELIKMLQVMAKPIVFYPPPDGYGPPWEIT